MKKNQIKNKKKKDIDKILLIVLAICTVLCFGLGVSLYIVGIRKIVPIILIFCLSFFSSLIVLLLSREVLFMKKRRDSHRTIEVSQPVESDSLS